MLYKRKYFTSALESVKQQVFSNLKSKSCFDFIHRENEPNPPTET